MGEKQVFQPLTREDRITVVLYRAGIVLSAAILLCTAIFTATAKGATLPAGSLDMLLYGLYASTSLSVFFIHLYIGKLKEFLKLLYYLGLACLGGMFVIGGGSPAGALARFSASALLLLPLACCLGFVTAKEAFCFRLVEGYLLAMLMPLSLLLAASSVLTARAASTLFFLNAAMFVFFTLRKVFMPVAYDIGDKSAYQ